MKRTNAVKIGDVLAEFFERPYVARRVAEGRIPDLWREVVGDEVADQCSDMRYDNGILYVKIESSLLRHELFYQREALKERINALAKVKVIGSVILK